MTVSCSLLRPESSGSIRIRSADPRDYPVINPNYLDAQTDLADLRTAVKLVRELMTQHAFDEYRGDGISPVDSIQSDDDIDNWVRAKASTVYHPCCTARMGEAGDTGAVVDAEARVFGVERLRVVDASIMPSIVGGNLNGPVIMLAEKVADMIRGRAPLLPSAADVYEAPNWKSGQR